MEEGSLCTEVNCVCTLKRQGPGRCADPGERPFSSRDTFEIVGVNQRLLLRQNLHGCCKQYQAENGNAIPGALSILGVHYVCFDAWVSELVLPHPLQQENRENLTNGIE